jgi:acetyltransferase-like isoleucine patch superfamily enzyme
MDARIDPKAHVETGLFIHNARPDYSNLCVGAGAYIGNDCFLDLSEKITVEDDVTIAMRVTILTHFDGGNSFASKVYSRACQPVLIGSGSYIGAGAILMPGTTINADAIVAAGAVVSKDVPLRTLVGGIPARVIRPLSC